MSLVPAKANLSFSIENILKEENSSESSLLTRPDDNDDTAIALQQGSSSPERSLTSDLPWLAYTRYCPPKIPRSKNRKTINKRKVSGSPRVPFSSEQLLELEKSYEDTHYVTAAKVSQLSSKLKLPGNRIKIWFQNRRAREKKKARKVGKYQNQQLTENETSAETTITPQEKIDENRYFLSQFYPAPFGRRESAFSPMFMSRLVYTDCPLKWRNLKSVPYISNVPRFHNLKYVNCDLHKGVRCFVQRT